MHLKLIWVFCVFESRLLEKAQFKRLLELASEALRAVGRASDSIVVYSGKQRRKI